MLRGPYTNDGRRCLLELLTLYLLASHKIEDENFLERPLSVYHCVTMVPLFQLYFFRNGACMRREESSTFSFYEKKGGTKKLALPLA